MTLAVRTEPPEPPMLAPGFPAPVWWAWGLYHVRADIRDHSARRWLPAGAMLATRGDGLVGVCAPARLRRAQDGSMQFALFHWAPNQWEPVRADWRWSEAIPLPDVVLSCAEASSAAEDGP